MKRLAERRKEYVRALENSLERILKQLAGMSEVELVILFGSYAAGRRDLLTDLDLLVVMSSGHDFLTRNADLYQQLDVDVDLDLLAYTPEEFERLRHGGFVRHILNTGRVVYEKRSFGRG